MDDLSALKESLARERPGQWDSLPDLELYMDQVLNYMPRQQIIFRPEAQLTAAMINNYIKAGLLHRTNGKRYSRPHLALLTAICVLKQILSVRDISTLFSAFPSGSTKNIYEKYHAALDEQLTAVAADLPEDKDPSSLPEAAIYYAIASYANKVACERIIDIISKNNSEEKQKK